MIRTCSHCHKPLTPKELDKEESKGMESDRKALGLQGVLFRYYTCSQCQTADIFVDVLQLEGESREDFHQRREELEQAVHKIHEDRTEIVLVERHVGAVGK